MCASCCRNPKNRQTLFSNHTVRGIGFVEGSGQRLTRCECVLKVWVGYLTARTCCAALQLLRFGPIIWQGHLSCRPPTQRTLASAESLSPSSPAETGNRQHNCSCPGRRAPTKRKQPPQP